MREPPFVFFSKSYTFRGPITAQQVKNEYYYEHLERINAHAKRYNKGGDWVKRMKKSLVSICGEPVKLTRFQNFLANYLMF